MSSKCKSGRGAVPQQASFLIQGLALAALNGARSEAGNDKTVCVNGGFACDRRSRKAQMVTDQPDKPVLIAFCRATWQSHTGSESSAGHRYCPSTPKRRTTHDLTSGVPCLSRYSSAESICHATCFNHGQHYCVGDKLYWKNTSLRCGRKIR